MGSSSHRFCGHFCNIADLPYNLNVKDNGIIMYYVYRKSPIASPGHHLFRPEKGVKKRENFVQNVSSLHFMQFPRKKFSVVKFVLGMLQKFSKLGMRLPLILK